MYTLNQNLPKKPVKQKRVVVYIPEDDYKKLRSSLILDGQTVSGWLRGVIKDFLKTKKT